MDTVSTTFPRRIQALLLAALAGLAAFALMATLNAAQADAKVRLAARFNPQAPGKLLVAARANRATKRVVFFVNGRRRGVRQSLKWRFGRKGLLRFPANRRGQYRIAVRAVHQRGGVSRARRVIHLASFSAKGGNKKTEKPGLGKGRPVDDTEPTDSTETTDDTETTDGSDSTTDSESQTEDGVLFRGNFDDGFDSWYVQSLSDRASIFSEGAFKGSAARFEVRDGDVEPDTGSERSEVSGPTFEEGQDLYFRDLIRVPSANSYSAPWQIIHQLHEHDWGGPPGIAVFLDNERDLKLGAGDSSPIFWHSAQPLEHDRWYALVYRVKLSRDPGIGFVEVWLDGVPQRLENGETRIYGQTIQTSSTYLKAGIYRSKSSTGTSIIEHDDIVVGTSYDAVMG